MTSIIIKYLLIICFYKLIAFTKIDIKKKAYDVRPTQVHTSILVELLVGW